MNMARSSRGGRGGKSQSDVPHSLQDQLRAGIERGSIKPVEGNAEKKSSQELVAETVKGRFSEIKKSRAEVAAGDTKLSSLPLEPSEGASRKDIAAEADAAVAQAESEITAIADASPTPQESPVLQPMKATVTSPKNTGKRSRMVVPAEGKGGQTNEAARRRVRTTQENPQKVAGSESIIDSTRLEKQADFEKKIEALDDSDTPFFIQRPDGSWQQVDVAGFDDDGNVTVMGRDGNNSWRSFTAEELLRLQELKSKESVGKTDAATADEPNDEQSEQVDNPFAQATPETVTEAIARLSEPEPALKSAINKEVTTRSEKKAEARAQEDAAAAQEVLRKLAEAGGAVELADLAKSPLENAPGAAGKEAEVKPVSEQAVQFDTAGARTARDEARDIMESARAALAKYEGVGGWFRGRSAEGKMDKQYLQDKFEKAKAEFERASGEYKAASAAAMLDAEKAAAMEAGQKALENKGFVGKAIEGFQKSMEKLGTYNLERLGIKPPKNAVGRFFHKLANARTVVSFGLLGVGVAGGFGITSVGVALGATGLRRALLGGGTTAAAYDRLRYGDQEMIAKFDDLNDGQREKSVFRRALDVVNPFAKRPDLTAIPTPEQLKTLDDDSIILKMEQIQARAALGARDLSKDPLYAALQGEVRQRLEAVLATADSEEEKQAMLELYRSEREHNVAIEKKSYGRAETRWKAEAVTFGVLVGAYQTLSDWFTPKQEAVAVAKEAAKHVAPHAAEAPPTVAGPDLTEIHKGDGYVKIFDRQIEADPGAFGYDAARDGDLHKWAMKVANRFAKEQGVMGKGLRFDAAHPGHVTLHPDGTFELTDAKDYVRHAAKAVEAAPVEHAPIAQDTAGAHETVSADGIRTHHEAVPIDRVRTYVDADGTPYLQHDWKQFHFGPKIPADQHEAIVRLIDSQGRETQALVRMMDEARAQYGHEPWFNKFDASMQKVIRSGYVEWKHNMRIAAGVDAGKLPLDNALAKGDLTPHQAAQMTFNSVRLAGGYPEMSAGPANLETTVGSTAGKAFDAIVGGAKRKRDLLDLMDVEPKS